MPSSLQKLQLPTFLNADEDPEQRRQLQEWKIIAHRALRDLKDLLTHENVLTEDEVVDIVVQTIPFDGDDVWSSDILRVTAHGKALLRTSRCTNHPTRNHGPASRSYS